MTPDLPLAYAYGDNRRTTKGLTRDHCPLPTLRTFLSLLPLVALTFPPTPFLSRTAGEEGGMLPPYLPSGPLQLLHGERKGGDAAPDLPSGPLQLLHGERKGGMLPPTFPLALFRSSTTSGRGKVSVAVATLRLRLSTIPRPPTSYPLSRSAGAGLGVRASRSAGAGLGVRAARSAGAGLEVRAARSAGAGLGVRAARSAGAGLGVRAEQNDGPQRRGCPSTIRSQEEIRVFDQALRILQDILTTGRKELHLSASLY